MKLCEIELEVGEVVYSFFGGKFAKEMFGEIGSVREWTKSFSFNYN